MYAVSVDREALYTIRYSPLGLPNHNAILSTAALPAHARTPAAERVQLYARAGDGAGGEPEWRPIPWPRHAWWTRFFVTVDWRARGTRTDHCVALSVTAGPILAWWLRNHSVAERAAFFDDPSVPAVVRRLRALRPTGSAGLYGWVRNLQRALGFVRDDPVLLLPCPDAGDLDTTYSEARSAAATRFLIDRWDALRRATPFSVRVEVLDSELLCRYGCRFAEALRSSAELLLRTTDGDSWSWWPPAAAARIRSVHALHLDVAVVAENGAPSPKTALVAPRTVVHTWIRFATNVRRLLLMPSLRPRLVLLVDAPIAARYALYRALLEARAADERALFVKNGTAAVANAIEEFEAGASVVRTMDWLFDSHRAAAHRTYAMIVVDGMSEFGAAWQTLVATKLAAAPSSAAAASVVILGGNGGVGPWSTFCATVPRAPSDPVALVAERRRAGAAASAQVCVWRPPSGERSPAAAVWRPRAIGEWHEDDDDGESMIACATFSELRRALSAEQAAPVGSVCTRDGVTVRTGTEVRVQCHLPHAKVHAGDVLRCVGLSEGAADFVPVRTGGGDPSPCTLPRSDVVERCLNARYLPIAEWSDCHYTRRPVVVFLGARTTAAAAAAVDGLGVRVVVVAAAGVPRPPAPPREEPDPAAAVVWETVARSLLLSLPPQTGIKN